MEDDWMKVYATANFMQATIIKDGLESIGIRAVLMDKSGKPYNLLGEVEIYVHVDQAENAIHYIYQL